VKCRQILLNNSNFPDRDNRTEKPCSDLISPLRLRSLLEQGSAAAMIVIVGKPATAIGLFVPIDGICNYPYAMLLCRTGPAHAASLACVPACRESVVILSGVADAALRDDPPKIGVSTSQRYNKQDANNFTSANSHEQTSIFLRPKKGRTSQTRASKKETRDLW